MAESVARRILQPLAFGTSLLLLVGCWECPPNEIHGEYQSPNGNLKAVVFVRECGATTAPSTQVSIISAKDKLDPNSGGNVFRCEGEPIDSIPLVTWLNDSHLLIDVGTVQGFDDAEVSKADDHWGWLWNRVAVTYKGYQP